MSWPISRWRSVRLWWTPVQSSYGTIIMQNGKLISYASRSLIDLDLVMGSRGIPKLRVRHLQSSGYVTTSTCTSRPWGDSDHWLQALGGYFHKPPLQAFPAYWEVVGKVTRLHAESEMFIRQRQPSRSHVMPWPCANLPFKILFLRILIIPDTPTIPTNHNPRQTTTV